MTRLRGGRIRTGLWFWMGLLLFAGVVRSQRAGEAGLEITTQERLETEPWWPTLSAAPVSAYAGSEACGKCHDEGAQSTGMRRASEFAAGAHFLKGGSVSMQSAAFHYTLSSTPHGLDLSVASGDQKLSQELAWVMGAGDLARTFLYQSDGRWLQSEVSLYTGPASLDITTGLARSSSTKLSAALGQPLSREDVRSCFGCHTVHATTSAGLNPMGAEAGVGCEACHGPGREHLNRMSGREERVDVSTTTLGSKAIFAPSRLSPSDSIDFCGSCHRSSADAKLSVTQAFGMSVIRFQPYRLEESKCWRATKDRRLTCVACHNPHEPLERDSVAYDKHCLGCHGGTMQGKVASATTTAQVRVCPKASANCVSCHMPKVAMPTMHGDFTDHYIRVARKGEPPPR